MARRDELRRQLALWAGRRRLWSGGCRVASIPFMPGMNGTAGVRTLCERLPTVPIVVISMSDRASDVRHAIDFGAKGYIPKTSTADTLKKIADAYNRTRMTPTVHRIFKWWMARARRQTD